MTPKTGSLGEPEPYGRRAAWGYLVRIGGGLVVVGAILVALFALGGTKAPDRISSENSKNIYFFR